MSTLVRVILVSNDIVPGCGLPVAAPGLRVHGLAAGLTARGYPTSTVIVRGPLDRQWQASVPPPTPHDAVALGGDALGDYLTAQAPAVVVLTNSNQIDRVPVGDGNRYVLDFFAPKALELVSGTMGPYPVQELEELRVRKLRAIERADGFIVNGRKKLPYFLAWILQTDRDVRTLPFEHVGMCLPAAFEEDSERRHHGPVRCAIAGYLQGWSIPGTWLRALSEHLLARRCTLDAVLPEHWGGRVTRFDNPELERLVETGAVRIHGAKTLTQYLRVLGECDVVLDLFDRTRERELAVVTRTIVALCCGRPVLHPPFTEVAPLIEQFDAGWLVDPADPDQVAGAVAEIVSDREAVARKAHGARELWRHELDPAVAVEGLVRVIEQVSSEVGTPV